MRSSCGAAQKSDPYPLGANRHLLHLQQQRWLDVAAPARLTAAKEAVAKEAAKAAQQRAVDRAAAERHAANWKLAGSVTKVKRDHKESWDLPGPARRGAHPQAHDRDRVPDAARVLEAERVGEAQVREFEAQCRRRRSSSSASSSSARRRSSASRSGAAPRRHGCRRFSYARASAPALAAAVVAAALWPALAEEVIVLSFAALVPRRAVLSLSLAALSVSLCPLPPFARARTRLRTRHI